MLGAAKQEFADNILQWRRSEIGHRHKGGAIAHRLPGQHVGNPTIGRGGEGKHDLTRRTSFRCDSGAPDESSSRITWGRALRSA